MHIIDHALKWWQPSDKGRQCKHTYCIRICIHKNYNYVVCIFQISFRNVNKNNLTTGSWCEIDFYHVTSSIQSRTFQLNQSGERRNNNKYTFVNKSNHYTCLQFQSRFFFLFSNWQYEFVDRISATIVWIMLLFNNYRAIKM